MSEEQKTQPTAEPKPAETPPQAAPADAAPKKLLKVYGREFDVSTDAGLMQAQTWAEAMSTLAGKQSTEIGELRKFKASREALPKSYEEVLQKTSELQEAGKPGDANKLMLNFVQEQRLHDQKMLEAERENDRLWDRYFDGRPDLLKKFGRERIRSISEKDLDLTSGKRDAFQVLDEFWGPFIGVAQPASGQTAANSVLPPATLSGGSARPAPEPAPANGQPPETAESILDKFHASNRR